MRWHDTDNGEAFTVEVDLPADNVRIASEQSLPEFVAQDNDTISACTVIITLQVCARAPAQRLKDQRDPVPF